MNKKLLSFGLGILILLGAAFAVFFFVGEDLDPVLTRFVGGEITEVTPPIQESSEEGIAPSNSLLAKVLSGTLDLERQTRKLMSDGFEDNIIVSDITSINKKSRELGLNINLPSEDEFEVKSITANVECSFLDVTVVSEENLEIIDRGIDIFSKANVGDALWTYCLDDSCNAVGRECVLIETTGDGE